MKNPLCALVLSSLVFTGCNFQKAIGVPLQIQPARELPGANYSVFDLCQYEQKYSFFNQYAAMKKIEKKAFQAAVPQKFSAVEIQSSKKVKVLKGEIITLAYVSSNGNGGYYRIGEKTIGGAHTSEGRDPVTQVAKVANGDRPMLSVTLEGAVDERIRRVYYTKSVEVYDRSESFDDADFVAGRQNGDIFLQSEEASPLVTCSKSAKIQDAFSAE